MLIYQSLISFIHTAFDIETDTASWWYMPCGRVLGMHNGQLIEYDPSSIAPLGLVICADELVDKKIGVINSEVVLLDKKDGLVSIVRPNDDGSYWRRFDRDNVEICAARVVQPS